MPRPVSPTLPDEGLLVGWSLESEPRKPLIGFTSHLAEGTGSQYLEPILHSGEGHLLTVAPTGAGKGVGCIVPALLRYPGPVVVIDPKGENYAVTGRARRAMGQRVICLDPFGVGIGRTAERGTFNPLDFLSPDNPSFVEDAEMIATTLVTSAGTRHSDPFWPHMGGQLLTLLLMYQVRRLLPKHWTLTTTRDLLAKTPEEWETLGKELMEDPDPEISKLAGVVTNPARETFGGYWAFSQMQTSCFKGRMVAESIETSSFSLQELVDGDPLSIYVIIPPEKLDAYGNLLKVWLSVMIAALTNRRSKPAHPTLFILDEAAQLGTMPQLRRAITLLRGYGVRVWSFWQDLSQLRGLYPDTWQTLLNNCHVHQFFGQSTRLGSEQTWEVAGLGSPEYLQALERNEMVLSVLGDQPVIARVPNYLVDRPFEGLFDKNPYYEEAPEPDAGIARAPRIFRRSSIDYDARNRFSLSSTLGSHLIRAQQFHPVAKANWQPVRASLETTLLEELRQAYQGLDGIQPDRVSFRTWPLCFYPDYDYYEITIEQPDRRQIGYFLRKPGESIFLDGTSTAIHELNDRLGLDLQATEARDYLYFFCSSIEAEDGRFLIVDDIEDLTFRIEPDEEYLRGLAAVIQPPSFPRASSAGGRRSYSITATVLYADALFRSSFVIHADGAVEMLEDEKLFGQMPVMKDTDLRQYQVQLRPRSNDSSATEN